MTVYGENMTDNNSNNCARTVVVVGAGAAGMMAAIHAASCGAKVYMIEKNERVGRKLRITGKGRCNVTNACDVQEFLSNVPTNPRFLYTALSKLSTYDTMEFFEECGVKLKTERGKRVFPQSDKASDIVDALQRKCMESGVIRVCGKVTLLDIRDGRIVGAFTADGKRYGCDAAVVCTGGRSYSATGSDGDGYRFAKEAGHTVTELVPSLVPIVSSSHMCRQMQGLSLKNVSLKVVLRDSGKVVYEDFGEMMFTHFGMTGPMILSASAHLPNIANGIYDAHIDFKPALDSATLDARIRSDFMKYSNRDLVNALNDLLPLKAIEPMISVCGIDPRKKVNSVTKEERHALLESIKCFKVPLLRLRPIDEAIVTKGGVCVNEIDPKTMQSKIVSGLFFAGEVIDVDAYTGGFNLQIAFSTAAVAGESAAYGS